MRWRAWWSFQPITNNLCASKTRFQWPIHVFLLEMMELGKTNSCSDGIRIGGERAKVRSRSYCLCFSSCKFNLGWTWITGTDREMFALFRNRNSGWIRSTWVKIWSFDWKFLRTVMELGSATLSLFETNNSYFRISFENVSSKQIQIYLFEREYFTRLILHE